MAARAGQAVELIFHDIRHDDRQFGHLMTQGMGIVAPQRLAATTTGGWLARDGLPDLLGRDQQAQLPRMTRLAAGLLPGLVSRSWRARFAVKAVRRGRQGRIGGIGPQLGKGVRQLLLDLLETAFQVFDLVAEI